jgi:hypothetical protein
VPGIPTVRRTPRGPRVTRAPAHTGGCGEAALAQVDGDAGCNLDAAKESKGHARSLAQLRRVLFSACSLDHPVQLGNVLVTLHDQTSASVATVNGTLM